MPEAVALATSIPAPWGTLTLATTRDGLAALEILAAREQFLERLERRLRGPVEWVSGDAVREDRTDEDLRARLDETSDAVRRWLAGDRAALAVLPLDLSGLGSWDALVLGAVRSIPWGSTAGYGEVARMIGKPGAARAVGGAVGRNPIGLAIPCHRVIAGDGTIGGYGGGWWGERETLVGIKRQLLAREGVQLPERPANEVRKRAPATSRRG